MAQRARIKVLKSREAAEQLHSQRAMSRGDITRAMAATLSRDVSERDDIGGSSCNRGMDKGML